MYNTMVLVRKEIQKQNEKWGAGRHLDLYHWAAVLGEEVGEVHRAINEHDTDGLLVELAQTAAVCLQIMADLTGDDMY